MHEDRVVVQRVPQLLTFSNYLANIFVQVLNLDLQWYYLLVSIRVVFAFRAVIGQGVSAQPSVGSSC